jgi:hypothetical protein
MDELNIAGLAESLDAAREPELAVIRDALDANRFIGVTGPAEAGKTHLLRRAAASAELDRDLAVVWVDLDGVYSPRHLARRWLTAIARAATGQVAFSHIRALQRDVWPRSTRRADNMLREILGENYQAALGAVTSERSKGGDEEVARALASTERLADLKRVLIVVDHLEAPELSRALDVRNLLWQIRATTQASNSVSIAVACRPGAVALASDENSAFFGDGRWVTVEVPRQEVWLAATGDWPPIADIWPLTDGHVWSTFLTVDRLRRDPQTHAVRAFAELAVENQPLAARSVQHAASLHRLGPQLLRGIASKRGPYRAIPDAATRDVAAAAQRLELGGLTHRPQRGTWRVINPFVAEVLRDRATDLDAEQHERSTVEAEAP